MCDRVLVVNFLIMRRVYDSFLDGNAVVFDYIHHYWEGKTNQRIIGAVLVGVFLASLLGIGLVNLGFFQSLTGGSRYSFYMSIDLVFTFLLIVEVVSLVLSLSHSVAVSMGKQFELLALILLRKTFKDFSHIEHPIDWSVFAEPLREMVVDAFGALLIFVGLMVIYRLQQHKAITRDELDKLRFIVVKKFVANLLLLGFMVLGVVYGLAELSGSHLLNFFESFYTVLIFSDILIVLISLRYSYSFLVLFRNSGFAFATLVIRLGLSAPTPLNVALGVAAVVFVLGLTVSYNYFNTNLNQEHI